MCNMIYNPLEYVNYLGIVPKGCMEFWAIKVFDSVFYCDIIPCEPKIVFFVSLEIESIYDRANSRTNKCEENAAIGTEIDDS